jgi:NADH:ubiquinone oxidoreductase subunit F (NADH-binding)
MSNDSLHPRIALRGIDTIAPLDLKGYMNSGGFAGFKKALSMNPSEIVKVVEASGLRGRGGAGFPTGMKWSFAAREPGSEKYIIANADEGEPGTFKDRYIMEKAPFRFLEGLMIGAVAVGAREAWIYIRHEYTRSTKTLEAAIALLYTQGYAGADVLGTGHTLDLFLTSGAGSYLCGDETTLLESMEGKRGNPRYKPPFPAHKGFRAKPSVVNNVETLAHVPDIVLNGADWYRAIGTAKSPGTKLYCLSGKVNHPGVYELPMGTTLRELVFQHGGGMKPEHPLKGVLLGGAAGTFADTSLLDVAMDYDQLKAQGATLGSGAVIAISDDDALPIMLENILEFFKHESCGKCVPCRIGCHRLIQQMHQLMQDSSTAPAILPQMEQEAAMMSATSLCGLGQSPILPIKSAIRYFANEFINPKSL